MLKYPESLLKWANSRMAWAFERIVYHGQIKARLIPSYQKTYWLTTNSQHANVTSSAGRAIFKLLSTMIKTTVVLVPLSQFWDERISNETGPHVRWGG